MEAELVKLIPPLTTTLHPKGDVNSKFILCQRDKPNGIQKSRVSWNVVSHE